MICYIIFDGFRRLTPDFAEPNGDGKIPVSTSCGAKKLGDFEKPKSLYHKILLVTRKKHASGL
jgi:hypothetical protein